MEKGLKSGFIGVLALLSLHSTPFSGKQRLILQIREPLRPTATELVLPATINSKGEVRDLKLQIQLGDSTGAIKVVQDPNASIPGLEMTVVSEGRRTYLIRLHLPQPAFVEVDLMDMHGKNLGVLFTGQCTKTEMSWRQVFKEKDPGGLRILAMKVNGKMVVKRVLPQVKQ